MFSFDSLSHSSDQSGSTESWLDQLQRAPARPRGGAGFPALAIAPSPPPPPSSLKKYLPRGNPVGNPIGFPIGLPIGIPIAFPIRFPIGLPIGIPIGISIGIPIGKEACGGGPPRGSAP